MRVSGIAPRAAAFVVLGGVGVSFAATIQDLVPSATAETLSASPLYAPAGYVSVVTGSTSTSTSFALGSGVIVAPNWVMTAAHVVTNTSAVPYSPSVVTFGQGTSIPSSVTGTYSVDQVVVVPGWAYNFAAGNDLALIHLTTSVTGVTPANLYTTALGSEKSLVSTLVGYGTTGTGTSGATTFDGVRRGTTNTIDAFGGDTTSGPNGNLSLAGLSSNILFEDFDNPLNANESTMGSTAATAVEGVTGEGDSGGGLYVAQNGTTYVAGITSFISAIDGNANSDYGDIGGYTRVSQYTSFINTYVPEPASLSLVSAAGLLALRRGSSRRKTIR